MLQMIILKALYLDAMDTMTKNSSIVISSIVELKLKTEIPRTARFSMIDIDR